MTLTREQLESVITSGKFDVLIGEIEDVEFECKGQPYRIENDEGKRELAKDVSAFANSNGGIIFIGVKTRASGTHFGDEVEEIRPLDQRLVNISQYVDTIRSWVYPEIKGINIGWFATSEEPTKGLVIIRIPTQEKTSGPFLVTKTLDGNKKVETIFGYTERKGDKNPPLEVKDLQKYLRSGFHYEEKIEERLDAIEILVKKDNEKTGDEGVVEQNTQRIERAIGHGGLKDGRLIIISAQPRYPKELRTIFLNEEGSLKKSLENPPILRRGGWDIQTLDQAKILRGEMIRVTNGDRKVIDLYRDGTMVFAASADNSFLAWGNEELQNINPLALAEVVYSFISFYKLVITDFIYDPREIIFRLELKNMHLNAIKNTLGPYSLQSRGWKYNMDLKEAPENNFLSIKSFSTSGFNAAKITYELVKEVYFWFGFREDEIPYIKEEGGVKIIDIDSMIKSGN